LSRAASPGLDVEAQRCNWAYVRAQCDALDRIPIGERGPLVAQINEGWPLAASGGGRGCSAAA
jgi:hypothetical protein